MDEEVNKYRKYSTLETGEPYGCCIFDGCDFSETDFADAAFEDCSFFACNFANAKLTCRMSGCHFHDCKMSGADFSESSPFSGEFDFQGCDLCFAIFGKVGMRRSRFTRCRLHEAVFYDADLSECVFDESDLTGAGFQGADLTMADLSRAKNFSIAPGSCLLKKTVFSEYNLKGLVDQMNIVIV